ncbi:MAG: TetR/AcrR family transcriptional regulator [Lachnospiraceae bacterium]|nr:TetR/AcrR family transcriptional regulator [Lachnospiraceae bacterium]
MPRKQTITKQMLIEGAFSLVREKGYGELSARHLAEAAGCSTQPIFRFYDGMKELQNDLFIYGSEYFSKYMGEAPKQSDMPFLDFSMAYILFAKNEPNLFRMLFLEENHVGKSMYDLVNGGSRNYVIKEIKRLPNIKPDDAEPIFMKIWLFIHGVACMILRDDFDMGEEELKSLLEDMFKRIVA